MFRYVRFVLGLFLARITRRRVPLLVTLCATRRRNLRCSYCYADFSRPEHLAMVEKSFGRATREHIMRVTTQPLKRRILED